MFHLDLPDVATGICGSGPLSTFQFAVSLSKGFMLFTPTAYGVETEYDEEVFGEDIEANYIAFTTDKYFVAANGNLGVVYDVAADGPKQIAAHNPGGQIVSIVSTLKRREIGFLLTNGKVEVCKF
jgi:hypothetical protein